MLFYALNIVMGSESVTELDKWAQRVVKVELGRAEELKEAWQPLDDSNDGAFWRVEAAFSGQWSETEMDKIGAIHSPSCASLRVSEPSASAGTDACSSRAQTPRSYARRVPSVV